MTDSRSTDSVPRHGGDLGFATARYGHPEGGWLDLSTGINPNPWPVPRAAPDDLNRLPQRHALEALIASARRAWRVAGSVPLIAAPGSEIAIRLMPVAAPAGPVAIVGPTYGSHAEAWRNAGRDVVEVASLDDVPASVAIVVLANPNNPDGRRVEPEHLAAVARRLGERNGLLIVDEAFADVVPGISLAPHLAGLPALVLRSFGKFFGLPGLRLGFVAGDHATVDRLASLLGDWPVSGPAIAIGRAALADKAWHTAARQRLKRDARRLRDLLASRGVAVVGGTDLFVLVDDAEAAALHRSLAEDGIWTRAFAGQPTWLRIGIPGDDRAFARLETALAAATAGR